MKRKKMIEKGWIEKKEFWMKKGEYGSWIINKKNKKKSGQHQGDKSQKKDLLDKNGILILSEVEK